VLSILFGMFTLMNVAVFLASGLLFDPAFLLVLLCGLGSIAAGVTLLTTNRAGGKAAPIAAIAVTAAGVLAWMILSASLGGPAFRVFPLPLAVPIFILTGLGLARSGRQA
jgi:hypothetical protein